MARDNVEVVREIYRDWERGDFSEVDWAHPDMEMTGAFGQPARGLAEVRKMWRDWLSSFTEWHVELEELVEGDDEVLALVRLRAHGKGSDIPIDQRAANVFAFRDGKVVRLELHGDRRAVLKRFGVAPGSSSE